MGVVLPDSLNVPKRLGLIWAQGLPGDAGQNDQGAPIGRDGTMPWHVPEDLAWFKQVTSGSPVVMGRRTWESLPERFRPLPGRTNIVVTRQSNYDAPGAIVCDTIESALAAAGGEPVWVIGGGALYNSVLAHADTIAKTQLDVAVPDADTFAPVIDPAQWSKTWASDARESTSGAMYQFEIWQRTELPTNTRPHSGSEE